MILVAVAILIALAWFLARFLQPIPPRRIVLASGPPDGMYHRHALRFKEILARDGITVDERVTEGSVENLSLLKMPGAAVDVALLQGGVATSEDDIRMLVSLFYEPLWIFQRSDEAIDQVNQLVRRKIATGTQGSGTRALASAVLAANGIAAAQTPLSAGNLTEELRALKAREVDAVFVVSAAGAPALQAGLSDASLRLLSMKRADAYARRFPHISTFTLPAGTIDLARDLPSEDVRLIGTKAMLVARADLHPSLVDLFIDAAREIHTGQGVFETAGEFPGIAPVDVPVSSEAIRYFREGPTFVHRFLPFWVATLIERLVVLVVPLIVVIAPLVRWLPALVRWRFEERVYRWYRELARLETDVRDHEGPFPVGEWLAKLEGIRRGVEHIRVPAEYARMAYGLRAHVDMVRNAIEARAKAQASANAA
jgi:TRAP transporter TAXI family solute receptor